MKTHIIRRSFGRKLRCASFAPHSFNVRRTLRVQLTVPRMFIRLSWTHYARPSNSAADQPRHRSAGDTVSYFPHNRLSHGSLDLV